MKKSDVELVEAIIDKMRELVDYYPNVRAFYEGKRPLKPYDFLSRKMREEDWDIIALLGVAMDEGFWLGDMPKELKGPFKDAHIALVGVFEKAYGKDDDLADDFGRLSKKWCEHLSKYFDVITFKEIFCDMLEYGAALCWREMKIWNEHPDWKLEGVAWTIWGNEYTRKELRAQCAAIGAFRKKHWRLSHFLLAAKRNLKEKWADVPCSFAKTTKGSRLVYSYEDTLRNSLTASVLCGDSQESLDLCEYEEWFGAFVRVVLKSLHDYFVRRAAECPKDARALWIEADADLVAFIYGGGKTLNRGLDADRIIELANRAAKADWVARRMANGYDDVKIEFPRPGERQAQSVRLDEGQLAALVSARADGRRDTNRIIGEVRKAAAGSDGGCHHRDKAKDKVVQAVIRHLAKPGVVFSVHDACEKVGGRRNASWLYSWCHDHEDEIHAQVDILRNAESAFRS